jgi:hypothetical protein
MSEQFNQHKLCSYFLHRCRRLRPSHRRRYWAHKCERYEEAWLYWFAMSFYALALIFLCGLLLFG